MSKTTLAIGGIGIGTTSLILGLLLITGGISIGSFSLGQMTGNVYLDVLSGLSGLFFVVVIVLIIHDKFF